MFWAIHERLVKGLFLDNRPHNVLKTNRFETVSWVGCPTVLTFHTVWRNVGRHMGTGNMPKLQATTASDPKGASPRRAARQVNRVPNLPGRIRIGPALRRGN